jgi:hypothetical protein
MLMANRHKAMVTCPIAACWMPATISSSLSQHTLLGALNSTEFRESGLAAAAAGAAPGASSLTATDAAGAAGASAGGAEGPGDT